MGITHPKSSGGLLEKNHTHWKSAELIRVDHDNRPEKRIPIPEKCKDRQGCQRSQYHRHDNPEENPELGDAVNPGSINKIIGNRGHELPHHEDTEGSDQIGQDKSQIGIVHLESGNQNVDRDHGDLEGYHHGG